MSDQFKIEMFVFPDGTPVEIIVFDETTVSRRIATPEHPANCRREAATAIGAATRTPHPSTPPAVGADDRAHRCPLCGCDLVYPIDWARRENRTWLLTLRCPNCELAREVVADREAVEYFNRWLYHSAQVLAHEADELGRCYFEEEAEKLVAALRGDLILPMDF